MPTKAPTNKKTTTRVKKPAVKKTTTTTPIERVTLPAEPPKRPTGTYIMWGVFFLAIILVVGLLFGYYQYTRHEALAEYKGGRVTREEFINRLRLEAGKYDPLVWKDEKQALKIKKDVLSKIVEEHLLLQQANKNGIKLSDQELQTELDSYKSGYSEATFQKMLESKGIDYKDWVEKKKNKHSIQKLISKAVVDKIEISDDEIKAYFNERKEEFAHPEQVRARHILVSNWETAEAIAKKLEEGGNFASIAKERSISPERWKGGDLGYFARGVYPEVFDRVCFNTPPGETSQVVKSDYGYHIFKVIDKRGPVKENRDEAKHYITTQLRKNKSQEAFDKWYQPIYVSANVKMNEDLLKRIEVNVDEQGTENE